MPGISVFLETNYSRTRELGIMERRRFIAGAALAASVPLAVACSRTDSATAAEFQLLPVSDKRVGDFMKYYSEFWTDPAKAVKDYTSPGVVYTSTSGQHFNQAALTSRLTDWAEGFTRVKSEPVFAAGLDNDQILLVIRDSSAATTPPTRALRTTPSLPSPTTEAARSSATPSSPTTAASPTRSAPTTCPSCTL